MDRLFDGLTSWADVFKRHALLNKEKSARMNLYPLMVAAIVCDAGGALEITEKALREALELRAHPLDMVPVPTGIQLTFRINIPDADPEPSDLTEPTMDPRRPKPSVFVAMDEWRQRVDRYVSDRRKLGGENDPRAEAAAMVLQWLWETISGEGEAR